MASFSAGFESIKATSATFFASFTGGDSSYSRYRYVALTIGSDEYEITSDESGGADSSFNFEVDGLKPDTTYEWEAVLGYSEGGSIIWLSLKDEGSFTTLSAADYIAPWSWSASNGDASDTQTKNAYSICLGTRPADDFSHLVWNDLVDKTYIVIDTWFGDWVTSGGKYYSRSETHVSAGDTLSAKTYNSLLYNLWFYADDGVINVSEVSVGDNITGYHIVHLAEALNNIIDGLPQ